MTAVRLAIALLLALLLAACGGGGPIPPQYSAYVGEWRGENVRLVITREGQVDYEKRGGNTSTSIKAPLQRFEGDNFVVGVGPLTTTFVVSKPPRNEDGRWRMTVDGVELVRHGGGDGIRA